MWALGEMMMIFRYWFMPFYDVTLGFSHIVVDWPVCLCPALADVSGSSPGSAWCGLARGRASLLPRHRAARWHWAWCTDPQGKSLSYSGWKLGMHFMLDMISNIWISKYLSIVYGKKDKLKKKKWIHSVQKLKITISTIPTLSSLACLPPENDRSSVRSGPSLSRRQK